MTGDIEEVVVMNPVVGRLARRLAAGLCLSLGLAGAAAAQTPDARGAREIEAAYAAYFSRAVVDKGIVSVAPDRDGYRVTWNLQHGVDLAEAPAGALAVEPLVYRLVPGAGGVWTLHSEHLPHLGFNFSTDTGHASGAVDFSGVALNGRYDPAGAEVLNATLSVAAVQAAFQVQDADRRSQAQLDEKGVTIELHARPGADGGFDVALAQATQDVKQKVSTPGSEPGDEQLNLDYEIGDATGGVTMAGLRVREIADLWKSSIARAANADSIAGLKPKLAAALPGFRDMSARAGIHDLAVELPGGGAKLKSLDERLGFTGLSAAGGLNFGVDIEDFELKSELAPTWSEALWPATLHLSLKATSDGWDQAARIALDDPHFGEAGSLSAPTQAAIASTLLAGHPKFIIEPGHLASPLVDVTFEGEAELAGGAPTARFKVSADGLDKLMSLLAELGKTDEDLQAAALSLSLLKGLAQTGDDGRLNWEIVADGDGQVLINGQAMPTDK